MVINKYSHFQTALQNKLIEEDVRKFTNGDQVEDEIIDNDHSDSVKKDVSISDNQTRIAHSKKDQQSEHDNFNDCSVKVLGLEVTSTCDVNKQWSRPHTPVITIHTVHYI